MSVGISNLRAFEDALKNVTLTVLPEQVSRVQRAVFLTLADRVIEKTPVDTGRARGNWQASIGTPVSREIGVRSGEAAKGEAQAVGAALAKVPYSVAWLSNNVPYVRTLEHGGYVPRNPPQDEESLARRAASRTERQRQRARTEHGHEGATFVSGGYSLQAPQGMVRVSIDEVLTGLGGGAG